MKEDFKDNILSSIREIAMVAGKKIMEIYAQMSDEDVVLKADNSPLTQADEVANHYIHEQLTLLTPGVLIISEEGVLGAHEVRRGHSLVWLVDPLDGTKEFIKKNGEFTINIALCENGRPVMGVVYAPALGQLFYAQKGRGAFMKKNGTSIKMTCVPYRRTNKGVRIAMSRSHPSPKMTSFLNQWQNPKITHMGSSLKFMLLAQGAVDVYPRLGPTMEWDTAAAQIILEEAGGSLVDLLTHNPLTYNKADLTNPPFIATGSRRCTK